jgi:hypothetical protein
MRYSHCFNNFLVIFILSFLNYATSEAISVDLTGENGKGSGLSTNSKRNDTFLEKLQAGQPIEEVFGGPYDPKSYTKTVPIRPLVSHYSD